MFFYQHAGVPASYYRQPVHHMYLQYQQPYRAAAQRRSAHVPSGGISAYVAGNQVAASGSFLKGLISRAISKKLASFKNLFAKEINVETNYITHSDAASAEHADPETLADDIPVAVELDDEGAVSIAEAYPAADDEQQEEVAADVPQHDEQPEFLEAPAADEIPAGPLADPLPFVPVALPKRKNKVTVQLDSADDDEVTIQQDERPVYKKKLRPAYGAAPAAAPSNPINTFFPINFGNTQGGAIAVANAYSTGQKGGARSHAIAYGSPASAAAKKRRQPATTNSDAIAQ